MSREPASEKSWARANAADRGLFERELKDFIPPDAFDAHAHLYRAEHLAEPLPALVRDGPREVGRSLYQSRLSEGMPGRCPTAGLFFAFPERGMNVDAANRFLVDELKSDPGSRALRLVTPHEDPAEVERQVQQHGFAGFKVYHVFADATDTFLAPSEAFLPEWVWEIANRRQLVITLHMVLPRALAEPANQSYLRAHCVRYPDARLILAHAARGFCGRHTVEGIGALRGLDNVFFDTSAVCEAAAFEAILETFGPTRLMFGSDFPVSELRTRCVDLGEGFFWLNEGLADFQKSRFAQPTLLGTESLLALRQACRTQRLTDGDIKQIFCLSARELLGLPTPAPRPDVQAAYRQAKEIIPGGTQLLSKRPEMFAPDQWPAYYREARGCEVIDFEGRHYIDMSSNGILACIFGFADPEINAAVIRRVHLGSMCTQQTFDEVELARLLIQIHPWAQMARFARCGGEAMAVAVRIARASTGRDKVAICGYHGWQDWYLAANLPAPGAKEREDRLDGHLLPGLDPRGVPATLGGTALPFRYNRLDELDTILARHGSDLAAVVMEPTRSHDPQPGFLEGVRARCDRVGARLVFDEITIGWRLCLGGSHLKYGVNPDLAVFAKTLGHGYPMSAIIGRRETMQAAQESFISSTYWTEGIGPAAALATVRKLMRVDAPPQLAKTGQMVMDGWRQLGAKRGLPVTVGGRLQGAILGFDHPEAAALATLMTARMLKQGFLAASQFNPSLAHEPRHVDRYLAALDEVFAEMAEAIRDGNVRARIGGPVKHSGFARLT